MRYLLLTALLAIAGCVTSPVMPLDDGSYLVSMHTAFSITPKGTLIEKAAIEAQAFCAKSGKDALVKNSQATGIFGVTSKNANVVFTCVAPTKPGERQ
jgi:hypothetical protein